MQIWHDIGHLKSYSLEEFDFHANLILEIEGVNGKFASLSLRESVIGQWGDTRRDLPQRFIEQLSTMIEPETVNRLTPAGLETVETGGHPEIAEALDQYRVKFLVATQPDKRRVVRVLLLDSTPSK